MDLDNSRARSNICHRILAGAMANDGVGALGECRVFVLELFPCHLIVFPGSVCKIWMIQDKCIEILGWCWNLGHDYDRYAGVAD